MGASMPPAEEPPSAVTTACPQCGEDTLHTVLHGRASTSGGAFTFQGTVECVECGRVHQATVKEPAPIEVPVIISQGQTSRKLRMGLAPDDEISVGEIIVVEGKNCKVTGVQAKEHQRWVDYAAVADIMTLWVVDFEDLTVGFAINMGHKTITKSLSAKPDQEFTIGQEHLFGRLRVTVHAIKTNDHMLKRGTAEASEIVRVFAKPTELGAPHRPPKPIREAKRAREARWSGDA